MIVLPILYNEMSVSLLTLVKSSDLITLIEDPSDKFLTPASESLEQSATDKLTKFSSPARCFIVLSETLAQSIILTSVRSGQYLINVLNAASEILKVWSKDIKNVEATQTTFNHRAKMCTLAALGNWSSELENK